jgi:hypothetical protein
MNIIYIVCHDLGRHLGCYGAKVDTPNLDRFAGENMQFNQAFRPPRRASGLLYDEVIPGKTTGGGETVAERLICRGGRWTEERQNKKGEMR